MTGAIDEDLYRRAVELLRPGDISLEGAVVHTDYGPDEESMVHQATIEVGDVVAEHAGKGDTWVYSGNDDSRFGLNQHQGLTIADDEFVWECQQLLREGSFDVVLYWETTGDHEAVLADIRDAGYDTVGITEDGFEGQA